MSQQTTRSETVPSAPDATPSGKTEIAPSAVLSLAQGTMRRAWTLRAMWGPVTRAVEAVASGSGETVRVLVVGTGASVLEAMLAHAAPQRPRFAVQAYEPTNETSLPFEAWAFDVAVAVDVLPLVRPSLRERSVRELCRVARAGVVIAGPFHSDAVAASERAVNGLHLAATGTDHPELGLHLEYGLPDVDVVRQWTGESFAYVTIEPLESLASWRTLASISAFEPRTSSGDQTDAAAAALLPQQERACEGPAYRSLLVGSSAQVSIFSPGAVCDDQAAIAMHATLEAAAQRHALERLTEAITTARSTERVEFREAVASLAAELHEREAQAEITGAALRERDLVIADQTAFITAMERRIDETDVHVRNLEDEREKTRVHVRNVEAERDLLREGGRGDARRAAELERELEDLRRRTATIDEELGEALQRVSSLDRDLEMSRQHAAHLEAALNEVTGNHERLLSSPGGRALTSYVRMKHKLLRK